jgi:hypothetical protein
MTSFEVPLLSHGPEAFRAAKSPKGKGRVKFVQGQYD